MAFWGREERLNISLFGGLKTSPNKPSRRHRWPCFSPPVSWDAWRSHSTGSVVIRIKCLLHQGFRGPVSDRTFVQLLTFVDEPLRTKLDGEHGNFTTLLDQVCLPLRGTILPPSRLKTLTWGRAEPAVNATEVSGRNKDLKTRACLTWPYIYENLVFSAEFQESQIFAALGNSSQVYQVTAWRLRRTPVLWVVSSCLGCSFIVESDGYGFLVREQFTDGLFFVEKVVSKQLLHLDTLVPGHLWTFQWKHKRISFSF